MVTVNLIDQLRQVIDLLVRMKQGIAGHYNIRRILIMVIFKNGQEVAKQAGVMGVTDIKSWLQNSIFSDIFCVF